VEDVVQRVFGLSAVAGSMFGVSTSQAIEIGSFLSVNQSAAPIKSLTTTIVAAWNQRRVRPELRDEMWKNRRARRLPSFVPISPLHQAAFIRGWFTGVVLGQIPYFDPNRIGPWTVWSPDGELRFLDDVWGPLPESDLEEPFALLETLPIVELMNGQQESQELAAYTRAIQLGVEKVPQGANPSLDYGRLSGALESWVEHGEVERTSANNPQGSDAPAPPEDLAGSSDSSPADRRGAVTSVFETFHGAYRELAESSLELLKTRDDEPYRAWESAEEATAALAQLLSALRRHQSQSTRGQTLRRNKT
jgi:hypothetical protein